MQLHSRGFETFTLKEVINKLKKPKQKYKEEKDKHRKSGNSTSKKQWKFFIKMDEILSKRYNVNPPTIMDSMLGNEDQGSSCSDTGKSRRPHIKKRLVIKL